VTSTTLSTIDVWFDKIFGDWFSRDLTAFMFLGVAALLIFLGLAFVFARPRGFGIALVCSGVITIITTWLWYALSYMVEGRGIALAFIIVLNAAAIYCMRRTSKPTPMGINYSMGSSVFFLTAGFTLYQVYFGAIILILIWPVWTPVFQFIAVPAVLLGTAACTVGVLWAVVNRLRAIPRRRPYDIP
jgi:hypothetical protein